jgi:hypothetical protein
MPFALQVIKPLIHFIIGIGNLEQPQSTTTGNRDEVNAAIFSYLPANGHVGKLAFYVLRLSLAQSYPKRVTLRGRIAIVTEGDAHIPKMAEFVIEVPATLEPLMPMVSVVPLQLLSYQIAVIRGCNVDQPRNLAKSVTVE